MPSKSPTRRDVLRWGALASGLLGTEGPMRWLSKPRRRDAPARAVIHIYLAGGLSHLDTFDPKPFAPVEVRGPFRSIPTKGSGERFTELLGQTAQIANHLCVIRSMSHGEAAHERGAHSMLTGYRPSPALVYPSLGSVVAHELQGQRDLPPYVAIPGAQEEFLGTGYLGAAFGPFSVGGEPNRRDFRVRDLATPKEVDGARVRRRRHLVRMVDEGFDPGSDRDAVEALDAFYRQAYQLIDSKQAQSAFDIGAEPGKLRDRYGRGGIGQRLVLARRLVESGVRYVTVMDTGYDHHQRLYGALRDRMLPLDQALSALIGDLLARKLLASTLVLVTTEFGRTPRFNQDQGRDHWPRVFSVVMAGGGIRGGVFHGASNETGSEPEDAPVGPADLAATVFSQLGIDPTRKLMSPGDRPIDIVRDGSVLESILG